MHVGHILGATAPINDLPQTCTSSLDPAQHTCPWLNQIALTTPSTVIGVGKGQKMKRASYSVGAADAD